MAIGVYLFGSVVAFLVAWAWITPSDSRRVLALLAVALIGAGLVTFVSLSGAIGVPIVSPGVPVSYRLPADYLARGAAGIAVMAVATLGALSPVIAALVVRHRTT